MISDKDPNAIKTLKNSLKHTFLTLLSFLIIGFLFYKFYLYADNNLIFIYEKALFYIIGFNGFLFFCWLVLMGAHHNTDEKYAKTKENFLIASYVFITLFILIIVCLGVGHKEYKERYFDCENPYRTMHYSDEEVCKRKEP